MLPEMGLRDIFEPPIRTYLLPEIEGAVLAEVRERYRNAIDPEIWKAQFDLESQGDYSQEFMDTTYDIVENVLSDFIKAGRIARLIPKQLEYVRDIIWEKAQSYWYEYAPELNSVLSFIDKVHQSSRKEIDELFPDCENIFGPNAYSLLIDLVFQYEFYRFSKISKPDLFDLRRMINISGQIVESIFAAKVFQGEDLRLGRILDKLSKSRKDTDSFLSKLSKSEASKFCKNLDLVNSIRNIYSHGTSDQKNIEENFQKCITALIAPENGLLISIHRILSNST
jgi:hypothetical protein